jgi:hypothetical protein
MVRRKNRQGLLEHSPFFNLDEIKVKSKLEPIAYNEKEDTYITKRIIYKSEEYVKQVIPNKVNLTEYYELSNLAKTLLFYITYSRLEYNCLTFHLNVEVFARSINYKSISKIYIAIKELINSKYIAKSKTKEVYWINHNKFYKGNYLVLKNIENK